MFDNDTLPLPLTLAELTTGYILAMVVLSAAAFALRKKPEGSAIRDDRATTLTTRGSYVPLVIGWARLAPLFGWAGDRRVEAVKVGGKGFFGRTQSGFNYYESAWHQLAIGVGSRLDRIIVNGKTIWTGPITRASTPSGTKFNIPGYGDLTIYWGEPDQPVSPLLQSRLDIASRYPSLMYVTLENWLIGSSAIWPQIEYEFNVDPYGTLLRRSPATMSATNESYDDSGVNGAHIIYQLLLGYWPFGAGSMLDPEHVNGESLERLGELLTIEHLPQRIVAADGATVGNVLSELLQDTGVMVTQVDGKLAFVPIRPVADADVPFIDDRLIEAGQDSEDFDQGYSNSDMVVYLYKDRKFNSRPKDVQMPDASDAMNTGLAATKQVDITTVIDRLTAMKVAERRHADTLNTGEVVPLNLVRSARRLYPGAVIETSKGKLRVASTLIETSTAAAVIRATPERFGLMAGYNVGVGSVGRPIGQPVVDELVVPVEAPYILTGGRPGLCVLRIRGNNTTGGADVYLSSDGSSYRNIGLQPGWAAGGVLETVLEADTLPISETVMVPFNQDHLDLPNLDGDNAHWYNGDLVVWVGNELCYARSITVMSDERIRINGLIRGRAGTLPRRHPAGTTILLSRRANLRTFIDAAVVADATLYVKAVPVGIDIAGVPFSMLSCTGRASAPYPVSNLGPLDNSYAFDAIIPVTWTFSLRDGNGQVAGERGWGQPLQIILDRSTPIPTRVYDEPESAFRVEILHPTLDTVLRTIDTGGGVPEWDGQYTRAMRNEDYGDYNPPIVRYRVTARIGSLFSESVYHTVYRRS